jgi:hypothetical protein
VAQKGVEKVREAPVSRNKAPEAKVSRRDEGGNIWVFVLSPKEFSAPPRAPEALSVSQVQTGDEGISSTGFLGKAVGLVQESLKYWKDTFEDDSYVRLILVNSYKIPVNMSDTERRTRYREKNNQSARNQMPYMRAEVARLLAAGQIVEVTTAPLCTNPLSVAFKVNMDGSIKKQLVIDLSRWVNGFVRRDSFKMAQFQDALAQSSKGDYQSVFDISKAYHHLRLHPSPYELVGFCVQDVDGKERLYHYVVVVFGLGPAGQALGRVMRPIMVYLAKCGIRNMMYVDDG